MKGGKWAIPVPLKRLSKNTPQSAVVSSHIKMTTSACIKKIGVRWFVG
jgi:hypothetical protein